MENPAKLEEEGAPLLDERSSPNKRMTSCFNLKSTYYSINGDLRETESLVEDTSDPVFGDSRLKATTLRDQTIIVQDAEDFVIPAVLTRDRSPSSTSARKQNSFVTIFAIWNTMLGTSILTMPWAIQQAGLICGIILMIAMAGLCLYTAYRVIQVQRLIGVDSVKAEYADVCRFLLGGWAEWLSSFFSIVSLLGAAIVYWVLMSNFLYNSVAFVVNDIEEGKDNSTNSSSATNKDVVCLIKLPPNATQTDEEKTFSADWNLKLTPLYLIVLVAPLVNFKSPTFFTKFNALGVVSAVFIMCFTIVKAATWGISANFHSPSDDAYIPLFQWSFPDLSGTLALSYFIHNCITSIMRNQKRPENNGRDLSVAYFLVAATYMVVGIVFYVSFPLPKSCITDNLLNNLTNADVLSFVARLFLLFQMLTVFPLLLYILRIQFFTQVFNVREPPLKFILPLNVTLIAVSILIAIYYPHIGQMIRYTGAFCGLAYCFTLPCLTYMAALRLQGRLTPLVVGVHVVVIGIGLANFVAQFLMTNT